MFEGPMPFFMDALRQKYDIMGREADSKIALQGAQTEGQQVQTQLAPGIAAAGIDKSAAEAFADRARGGLYGAQTTSVDQSNQGMGDVLAQLLGNTIAKRQGFKFGLPPAGSTPTPVNGATPRPGDVLPSVQTGAPPVDTGLPQVGVTPLGTGMYRAGGEITDPKLKAAADKRLKSQGNVWGMPVVQGLAEGTSNVQPVDIIPSADASKARSPYPVVPMAPAVGMPAPGVYEMAPDPKVRNPKGVQKFAGGTAKVPGKGTGKVDTVPAMLAPGEAVLNKGAAEHVGRGLIGMLNQIGKMRMGFDPTPEESIAP